MSNPTINNAMYAYKGKVYEKLFSAFMKINEQNWVACVVYQDASGNRYVREEREFLEKFSSYNE